MAILWSLWLGVIPSVPLVLTHGDVIAAITNTVLLLCAVALWCERERTAPKPLDFDDRDDVRLAA